MSDLVIVGSFDNPLEAHLAKGRLEVEGIETHVAHEHHAWAYSDTFGKVLLQVADEDAVRAQQILKAHLAGEYQAALEREFPEETAPARVASRGREPRNDSTLTVILLILFVLGLYVIYLGG